MAATQPVDTALGNGGNAPLRIVLFGRPAAGKSSLLGALVQAAQTQGDALQGRLTDVSQRLGGLRQRLYEGAGQETQEEIVPYPVAFEPSGAGAGRIDAVLVDCDGRVANNLLDRRAELGAADGELARALLQADAVILAVDASAPADHLDADFAEFDRFLRQFEASRGQRTDVGGLPVFLVLTKCDLLARPTDTAAAWMERIEGRKREVVARFRDLVGRPDQAAPAFGRIDLHLWATAVKRPELAGSLARPRDPYGVAELFRQCLDAARDFRAERRRSGRRLVGLAAGSMAVLAVLAVLVFALPLARRATEPSPLEGPIDRRRAQEQEQTPAARHRQPHVEELEAWVHDPEFTRVPPEKQQYVRNRLAELLAYQAFEAALRDVPDPADARNPAQLDRIAADLARLSKAYDEYRAEWDQTDAGHLYAEEVDDVTAVRRAAETVEKWYARLVQDGQQVLANAGAPNLPDRARKVLDEGRAPPFPEKESDKVLPGGKRATYATVFAFPGVAEQRRQWEAVRKRLARVEMP